jgi:hypothetical protein
MSQGDKLSIPTHQINQLLVRQFPRRIPLAEIICGIFSGSRIAHHVGALVGTIFNVVLQSGKEDNLLLRKFTVGHKHVVVRHG